MRRKTTKEFIEEAKRVHGNKYDYSKVVYINNKTKVCIICPIHGEFWQIPQDHLRGRGCSKCNGGVSHTNEMWLEKFIKQHGTKYKYLIENIKLSSYTKIKIECPKHGIFEQTCMNHSLGQGCPMCAIEYSALIRSMTFEEFVEKARKIHGNRYDYSKVNYINNSTKICIICPIHGEFWQTPNVHLLGHGCPKCSSSKLENEIILFLENEGIEYIHQANKKTFNWLNRMSLDFYIPIYNVAIECQGIEHFESINYFGGIDKFKETIKRDKSKKILCNKNKVKLLYYSNLGIEYPYKVFENKEELLKEIKDNG